MGRGGGVSELNPQSVNDTQMLIWDDNRSRVKSPPPTLPQQPHATASAASAPIQMLIEHTLTLTEASNAASFSSRAVARGRPPPATGAPNTR